MSAKRILLVEDEKHVAEGININLEAEGFDVIWATDGNMALEYYKNGHYDLIILDIMLPGVDGLEICRRIRSQHLGTEPILFLTARDSLDDKKDGLAIGADDYITKPFDLEELILRIKAIFRRQAWLGAEGVAGDVYQFPGGKIDFRKFEVESPNGKFRLSNKECLLLKLFSEHPDEVLSRSTILDGVWGYNAYPSSRTVDNFILRYRKYFEPDPSKPIYFHTEFGTGYRFTPKGKAEND
ncbi:Response regulator with CheY-like receiver domain and winged-helix DNA-binding domain [Candidatus Zixiibacteriota bacterium]|nr:Response regulator with CheY-like receiver domain and winged-helix DNA-binding domain [candidate division Zixibacteria bacterium]